MSLDPLQKLWQSQQLNIPVEKILAEAKKRQRRMFWLMFSDIAAGTFLLVWLLFYVQKNPDKPGTLPTAIFLVLVAVLFTIYSVWKRATTWGMDSLDVKNTLRLSIRRCEAGIQMGIVTSIVCQILFLGCVGLVLFGPANFLSSNTFALSWLGAWAVGSVIWTIWYKKRQTKKIEHYQSLLAQLKENDTLECNNLKSD
mgnify:CR=1 FL=1